MAENIDVELFYKLLEVDPDDTLYYLIVMARRRSDTLPPLILSVLERDGVALGTGAADELRRARARAAGYAEILGRMPAGIRAMKGPSIAARYPHGLVRPVGDLDLVAHGQAELWQGVREVLRLRPTAEVGVSVLERAGITHLVVRLAWPADDPILDRNVKVELCTMAFPGDLRAAPFHAELPADPWLADLLALAEERFQREPRLKDIIDLSVLFDEPLSAGSAVAAADTLGRAPELRELLTYVAASAEVPGATELAARLAEPADRERRRRERYAGPPVPAGTAPAAAHLAAGQPVHGLTLRPASGRVDWTEVRVHHTDAGALLQTPVADYLLVATELVDPAHYDAALVALADLPEH